MVASNDSESEPRGRWAPLVVLAVAALALGGAVYWGLHQSEPGPASSPAKDLVLRLDPARIRSISLLRRIPGVEGAIRIDLENTVGGWFATLGGVREAVPEGLVEGLVAELGRMQRISEIRGDQIQLAEFGLEPPSAELAIAADREIRIEVGGRSPAFNGIYLRIPPEPAVIMVGAVLHWELDKIVAYAAGRQKK